MQLFYGGKERSLPQWSTSYNSTLGQDFFPKKNNLIIAFLGKTIKEYRQNHVIYLDKLNLICPSCSSKTHWHCWYERFIKGEELPIMILRIKCCGCKKTHAVLPDLLSPYKQYPLTVIEKILKNIFEKKLMIKHVMNRLIDKGLPCPDFHTIQLWLVRHHKRERQYIGAIAGFLERHGLSVGVWRKGFSYFQTLINFFNRLSKQAINGSCLLGKTNILLAISQPGLWI